MTISLSGTLSATRAAHHTADYAAEPLVLRRGLPFTFSAAAPVTLVAVPAHPARRARTPALSRARKLLPGDSSDGWALHELPDGRLTLDIPASAAVGMYTLSDADSSLELVVLFNPYSPEDPVYMPSARERDEYVHNTAGLIWRGSAESNFPAAWDYAQFERDVLLTALSLLDRMPFHKRADIVAVTRHLSAAVNVQDDAGVLVGRWDGEYDDGTPPTGWAGSAAILSQYWKMQRPVRYGQCWVFAGLLTSCCRTLGIPCRTITNFASAHDTDRPYNRAVDLYFDRNGELIESKSRDSTWNFHVWSSAWMRRDDLTDVPGGMDLSGWQAIDATPQEQSQGLYQMGPSPEKAIKNGFTVDYDTDFVIGEVNADTVYYWQEDDSDEFKVFDKRTRNVGRNISTKAVGSNQRHDVTLEYKYAEGTPEERAALANRPSAAVVPVELPANVRFELQYDARVRMGSDVVVTIKAKNTSSSEQAVRFVSLARAIRYTGAPTSTVKRESDGVTLAAGGTGKFTVRLTQEQYQKHLVNDIQTIKFNVSAKVQEGRSWADECIVRVYGDDALSLRAPARLAVGQRAVCRATVRNNFRVRLTNTVLRAEGSGVAKPVTVELGSLAPGQERVADIPLEGALAGERVVVATVVTDELQELTKSVHVKVVGVGEMSKWARFWSSLKSTFCSFALCCSTESKHAVE